jgi:hypothetical protein
MSPTAESQANDMSAAAASSTTFRFLDLPKDIRFLIYDYFVVQRIHSLHTVKSVPAYKLIALDPAITQISRQVYDEAKAATRTQRLSEPLTMYFRSDRVMFEEFWGLPIMAHEFDQRQQAKMNNVAETEIDDTDITNWIMATCSKKL